MPKFAPETPTTTELHSRHTLAPQEVERIAAMRLQLSHALGGAGTRLAAYIGPCSMMPGADRLALTESEQVAELNADPQANVASAYRIPVWKPRTDEESWWGAETTHPEEAYALLHTIATTQGNVAMEIGDPRHLERYGHLLAFGWQGARNDHHSELTRQLAVHDHTLPIAVKNSLDGTLETSLGAVERIRSLRTSKLGAGAATLLFRGGANAQTPDDWEKQLLLAYDLNQPVVVDAAHGGEQAHDPQGKFNKSVLGQIACLDHLLAIADETGQTPAGVMIEASLSEESLTDPVIPLDTAIEKVRELAAIRQKVTQ
jgi:phospho-2-dehydro-3-deoxyheptonate aldolase